MKIHDNMTCLADENHIIDIICNDVNPPRGYYSGKTLAELKTEEPEAKKMPISEYRQIRFNQQNTKIEWKKISQQDYDAALGCVPPTIHTSNGFLIGEPYDHCAMTGEPRYTAYKNNGHNYSKSSRPMTKKEFKTA